MPSSVARVETANASRYLQQLCKHWSHKFEVSFDAAKGFVPFSPGSTLSLAADKAGLTMTLDSEEGLTRLQDVVADHLKRFAFREELVVSWQPH
ncbi:MAG: DUF2218 domain-containing protein [Shinella sp.]|jgi:uncharacterized protein|nr:DUF2218 domain-containing protein [Shinella sp.]